MTLVYVVGARPNFVKMAPVVAALRARLPHSDHVVVHTGQHYDAEMSELFLDELEIPDPAYRLGVGSGTHARQTGRVMSAFEDVVASLRPALVLVPGDVNSTLAAALVCAKLSLPYGHVESGLRSFDRSMPEEVNRIVADEFADLLFTHSDEAVENLHAEGIADARIHQVGNTMIDTLVRFESRFRALDVGRAYGMERGDYVLVTLHRPSLVDGELLDEVLARLDEIARDRPVIFPVHPRTAARVDGQRWRRIRFTEPLGYLEFLSLEADAGAVLTDSGGVQEETTYLGVPCFTLRSTTERPVTVRLGGNTLLGLEPARIGEVLTAFDTARPASVVPPQWDGRASERIAVAVAEFLGLRHEEGAMLDDRVA